MKTEQEIEQLADAYNIRAHQHHFSGEDPSYHFTVGYNKALEDKWVIGYKESLKADLADAIEQQEQQYMTKYNEGREHAILYALEMLDKHITLTT